MSTTVTVTQTNTVVQPQIRYDPLYIKTVPGILKVICIVLNLVGFICIWCSSFSHLPRGEYFNFVAMFAFWFSGLLLAFYMFHVVEKFFKIPWLNIEFGFYALWTLLYFIASILAVTYNSAAFTTAGFFGFLATMAYGYDAWSKWQLVRAGAIAQGSRVVRQTTQQTTGVIPTNGPPQTVVTRY